jgi:hypothetical protein
MPRPAHAHALALALAASACDTGFAPQYRVEDLRILAVRAQVMGSLAADADLGETVRLTALVANPLGRTPVRVRWATCIPDGTEALPPCLDPDALRDVDRLLADPSVVPLGEGAEIEVSVPLVSGAFDRLISRAEADPAYACSLYLELPVLVVAEAGEAQQVAVKRVRLTPGREIDGTDLAGAYVKNSNPVPLGVRRVANEDVPCGEGAPVVVPCWDDTPCGGLACGTDGFCAATFPQGRGVLCARPDPGAVDPPYNQCAPDGTRTPYFESMDWQWYVTGGEFPEFDGVGNATGDPVEFEAPDGPFTIWVILRDGRGGEAWLARDVPAQ